MILYYIVLPCYIKWVMNMQNIKQKATVIPNNFVCKPVLETKNKKNAINEQFYNLKKTTLPSNLKCIIKK